MQKLSFELDGEFVELNQLLKLVGLCDSGGAGKMIVASGQVKVDGKQESRKTEDPFWSAGHRWRRANNR